MPASASGARTAQATMVDPAMSAHLASLSVKVENMNKSVQALLVKVL